MTSIPQGTTLAPKRPFSFKINGKGRTLNIKAADRFWVASSSTAQQAGTVEVCRLNKSMGSGWHFSREQVEELFTVDATNQPGSAL